jgi:hypothetical protein
MKRLMLALIVSGIMCSYSIAGAEQEVSGPAPFEIKGTIIDCMCAEANAAHLPAFVKTHTKECALSCAAGGYAIVAEDGKVYKFDAQANAMVEAFLKKAENKLKVIVQVQQITDDLTLISIKNQK